MNRIRLLSLLSCLLALPSFGRDFEDEPISGNTDNSEISSPSQSKVKGPIETAFYEIMEKDNQARAEIDEWNLEEMDKARKGEPPSPTLRARIRQRLEPVHDAYKDFMSRNPRHAGACLAYGSFLYELGEEEEAVEYWDKGRELDPENPAAWNNLANYYGHRGPIKKAFEYYQKAIDLNPQEPVYYHNFGTTVYLFRKDAKEYFEIDEQEVFNKAFQLYDKATALAPDDFLLASDVAMTYYGIQPPRYPQQIKAYEKALGLARDEIERQGIYIHLARIHINAGNPEQARTYLKQVDQEMYQPLKGRLEKKFDKQFGPLPEPPDPAL